MGWGDVEATSEGVSAFLRSSAATGQCQEGRLAYHGKMVDEAREDRHMYRVNPRQHTETNRRLGLIRDRTKGAIGFQGPGKTTKIKLTARFNAGGATCRYTSSPTQQPTMIHISHFHIWKDLVSGLRLFIDTHQQTPRRTTSSRSRALGVLGSSNTQSLLDSPPYHP